MICCIRETRLNIVSCKIGKVVQYLGHAHSASKVVKNINDSNTRIPNAGFSASDTRIDGDALAVVHDLTLDLSIASPLLIPEALPPFPWILRTMKNGIYGDIALSRFVKDLERKPANGSMSKFIDGNRKGVRMPPNRKKTCLHTAEKILTQAWLPGLVPVVGFGNIILSLGVKIIRSIIP